nr:immunoglobulin light chain junction region [Macaca mulatta]
DYCCLIWHNNVWVF